MADISSFFASSTSTSTASTSNISSSEAEFEELIPNLVDSTLCALDDSFTSCKLRA